MAWKNIYLVEEMDFNEEGLKVSRTRYRGLVASWLVQFRVDYQKTEPSI